MYLYQTNLSYISFKNLNPNTEYVARFRTLINGTTNHTTDTPLQTTLDSKRIPDPVKSLQISSFDTTKNPDLQTLLTWEPSIGMCDIKILHNNCLPQPTRRAKRVKTNARAINVRFTIFLS